MAADPAQILAWFVLRWQLEVTFAEVRRHRGVATQRQWSDLALLRTTSALLGRCSRVTRWAPPRMAAPGAVVRQAAWYPKALPTFADALALVRRERWAQTALCLSASNPDMREIPRAFLERLTDALCYAA